MKFHLPILLALLLNWSVLLAEFGPVEVSRWSGHGDTAEAAAEFQLTDTGVAVEFRHSPLNGCWIHGELTAQRQPMGRLTFRGISTDGKSRVVAIHLNLRTPEQKEAGFLSYMELGSDWQEYSIDLEVRTMSWSEAHHGKLVFSGGNAGAFDLSEGEITSIMISSHEPGRIEIADLMIAPPAEDDRATVQLEARLREHSLTTPYQFSSTGESRFEIVRDGKSPWSIQIPSQEPVYAFAAEELARYVQRATRTRLPIVTTAQGTPAIQLKIATPQLTDDGFQFTGTAEGITILANNARSLPFAVYDFLEKSLDIRFFAPYDFAEIVPSVSLWELPEFQDQAQAAYSYRRLHYCSSGSTPREQLFRVADWNVKNRYNVQLERLSSTWDTPEKQAHDQKLIDEFYALRGGRIAYVEYWRHNYHVFIPPEKYFAEHPEYFPYDRTQGGRRAHQAQLCTTNADVIRLIGEWASEYFRSNPDAEFFPLFQEDGTTLWCQCDSCLAIVAPHRRDLTGFDADRVIYLANAVAESLQQEFPGKKVVTYAYSTSVTPPEVVRPNEHVYIEYCVYGDGNPTIPAYRTKDRANMEQWQALTHGRMILYSYHALGFTYQFRDPETMAKDLRYFADIGVRGNSQETMESWGMDGYLYYISARLAWNPWLDLNALEEDYFSKFYGRAAEPMRAFHHRLIQALSDSKGYVSILFTRKPCLSDAEIIILEELQRQAEELEPDSAAVAFHRKTLRYIQAANRMISQTRHLLEQPTETNRQQAIQACDTVLALLQEQADDWIVSRYNSGSVEHMKTMIAMIMEAAQDTAELQQDHTILERIATPWRFQSDGAAQGDKEQWFAPEYPDREWTNLLSGAFWEDQGFAGFDGIGWYRRELILPEDTAALRLYFGGADERAWVYWDGELIGAHESGTLDQLWQEPFYIDLPAGVSPGAHQLTVKVIDTAGGGGLWKDVYLVRRNQAFAK